MIDIKLRNRNVKNILSYFFGSENISVRNGRGTAWGWCNVEISAGKSTGNNANDRMISNDISNLSEKLLSDVEFYKYNGSNELIIQVRFEYTS